MIAAISAHRQPLACAFPIVRVAQGALATLPWPVLVHCRLPAHMNTTDARAEPRLAPRLR